MERRISASGGNFLCETTTTSSIDPFLRYQLRVPYEINEVGFVYYGMSLSPFQKNAESLLHVAARVLAVHRAIRN